MHVLGKVLMFFVVVGGVGAVILTAGVLGARNHWMKQVEEADKQYITVAADLTTQQTALRDANEAVDRAKNLWGNVWTAPNSGPTNAAQGTVQIGVGRNDGLAAAELAAQQPLPIVYAFIVDANGASNYVGEFQLEQVADNSATAKLTRVPFEGETFPSGTWRIRERIDFGYANSFKEMDAERVRNLATLTRDQYDITRHTEQRDNSNVILEERRKELEGNPDLADGSDVQKFGLVDALRKHVAARDALQERLDYLRRRIDFTRDRVEESLESNEQRVKQLGRPYNPPPVDAAAGNETASIDALTR